jgi:hypothetical protein
MDSTSFSLVFTDKSFPVPRQSLSDFFVHHQSARLTNCHVVQSRVSEPVFTEFAHSFLHIGQLTITQSNAAECSALAAEFGLDALLRESQIVLSAQLPASHVCGSVRLTPKSLASLPSNFEAVDFDFSISDHHHSCPWFAVCLLSPALSRLRLTDQTINEFQFETPDPEGRLPAFLALGTGSSLLISRENCDFYRRIALEMENHELAHEIDAISLPSVAKAAAIRDLPEVSPSSVEFLASHFASLTQEDFDQIPHFALHEILSSPRLQVSSEDEIYGYVSSRFGFPGCIPWLHYVQFAYLSPALITEFLSQAVDYCLEAPDLIWNLIRGFLIVDPHSGGIIASFDDDPGGLEITQSNVTHRDSRGTSHERWVAWHFHYVRFCPTSYFIKSSSLRSWSLEGSPDGRQWTTLDHRRVTVPPQFGVRLPLATRNYYHQFRVLQQEDCEDDDSSVMVSDFDLFGPPGHGDWSPAGSPWGV